VADWASLKWLLWIMLYMILGIFVPWFMTRSWSYQHGANVQPRVRQLFQHGELGLVGLILAISVIWDLQNSQFVSHTIALGSILLAFIGIMSGSVWIESYCRQSTGTNFNRARAWRDSRNLAFLIFSVAAVTEILLSRMAKAGMQ
jgi:uncharacterized membrane protein YjgN (DUF898 family)